jgi:hypothetical protein
VGWDPSSDSSGVNSKRGSNEPKAERRFAPDRRQASGILARQFCMKNRRGSRWRGSSDRRYWQESRSISLCADQPRLPLSSATSQSSPACVLATHARSNQPRPGESLLERKSNNARRVRRRPTVASCRSLTVFRRVRRVRMSIRENQPRARTYRLPHTPSHVTITRCAIEWMSGWRITALPMGNGARSRRAMMHGPCGTSPASRDRAPRIAMHRADLDHKIGDEAFAAPRRALELLGRNPEQLSCRSSDIVVEFG